MVINKYHLLVDTNTQNPISIVVNKEGALIPIIEFDRISNRKVEINYDEALRILRSLNNHDKIVSFLKQAAASSCCLVCDCLPCDALKLLRDMGEV